MSDDGVAGCLLRSSLMKRSLMFSFLPAEKDLTTVQKRLEAIGHQLLEGNSQRQTRSSSPVSSGSIGRGTMSLASSSRKCRFMARVRYFFYADENCTQIHKALLDVLGQQVSLGNVANTDNGVATTANSTAQVARAAPTMPPAATCIRGAQPHFVDYRQNLPQPNPFPPSYMPPAYLPVPFLHPPPSFSNNQAELRDIIAALTAGQTNNSGAFNTNTGPTPRQAAATTATRPTITTTTTATTTATTSTRGPCHQVRIKQEYPSSANGLHSASVPATSSALGVGNNAACASWSNNVNGSNSSNRDLDPLEQRLLSELQQMGFQDREEVIAAIRHCTNRNKYNGSNGGNSSGSHTNGGAAGVNVVNTTSDDVMMWIITQREEAEEARKMDEARLRSEQLRREQAERREQQEKTRLDSATLKDLEQDLFPRSWILRNLSTTADGNRNESIRNLLAVSVGRNENRSLKKELITLLKMEKDARKWYKDMPGPYFENWSNDLMDRFEQYSKTKQASERRSWVEEELKAEYERLQSATSRLDQQKEGVPRIFLEAYDAAKRQGRVGHPDDDEDDEIIVVRKTGVGYETNHTSQRMASQKRKANTPNRHRSPPSKRRKKSQPPRRSSSPLHGNNDVIEID